MSEPIKARLLGIKRALGQLKTASSLSIIPGPEISDLENFLLLEAALLRLQQEARFVADHINTIHAAMTDWTDLLRKLAPDERAAEEKSSKSFIDKEQILKVQEDANQYLSELRDLEVELSSKTKLYKHKAESAKKKEELKYAQQLASFGAGST